MEPNKLPVPRQLALSFSKQWEDFGNTSSPALVELWTIIFQTFNDCIERNVNESEGEYSVIPAVTGSGKTLCYRWYAAALAKQSLSDPDSPGMVIVTTLKKETDESVAMINEWVCREVSIAYNGDSDIKARNNEHLLDDHQIVIIQHEYFKRHHHLRSSSRSAYKQMMSYKGKDRGLIVIDESIQLIESIEISKHTLNKATGWLSEYKNDLPKEHLLVDYLRDNFTSLFTLNDSVKVEHIGKSQLLLNKLCAHFDMSPNEVQRVLELKKAVNHLKQDSELYSQGFTTTRGGSLNKYLSDIKYILDDSLYKYKEGFKLEYRASTLELPLKSLVVLDATAKVDKTYNHFPYARVVGVPKVKSYEDVTLNAYVVEGGVGRDVIAGDWYRSADNINSLLDSAELRGSEFVVFTFKDLVRKTPEYHDNFGNLTGVNIYKNCTEMVIYGLYYRRNNMYYDYLYQGSSGTSTVFSDEGKALMTDLKYSHIAADVIQMINRGCCRKIIDGKASKMKVSMLLPKNNGTLSDAILQSIRNEMIDININVLDAQFVTKAPVSTYDGNVVGTDQGLISELITCDTKKLKLSELFDNLGLTKRKRERVRGHLNKPEHSNTYLAREVKKLGYKVVTERKQLFLVKTNEA